MKNKEFIERLVEGAVSMTVSVIALYAGTSIGLKFRVKRMNKIIEVEEKKNESSELFND